MLNEKLTVAEMNQHIIRIAKEHNIEIRSHSSGRAYKQPRVAAFRPIKSYVTYIVALHEIGHILGRWRSKPRLWRETGAWQWAKDNALCWKPSMEESMRKSLRSYWSWQKRHATMKLPPQGHLFWDLVGMTPKEVKNWFAQNVDSK